MQRRAWTRPELLKALSLYTQLSFGQMHRRNPAVIRMAEDINRSPSSVALKLVNFASLDPDLQNRGIRGMANQSRADRAIWEEFRDRWQDLADTYLIEDGVDEEQAEEINANIATTEVARMQRTRVGQRYFRNAVLAAYDWRCCITNISAPELLRASHIIPWSESVEHRLDPRNGLCLNALHDAAFDRGLIRIGADNELILSPRLQAEIPPALYETAFERYALKPIRLPERFKPDPSFLKYHFDCHNV